MGTLLKAVCSNCDFSEEFLFGGGMQDFDRVCNLPAIEKRTGKFVVENYFRNKTNADLKFYNQSGMYAGEPGADYHQWMDVYLKSDHNICPLCNEFAMRFEMIGFYD